MSQVYGYLMIQGWNGIAATKVEIVGSTPKRFRIKAITPTKLAGGNRWLNPGEVALVPHYAIRPKS